MPTFHQVKSVTMVDKKPIVSPITVPVPVGAVGHRCIDTSEALVVQFFQPADGERNMLDVMTRVANLHQDDGAIWYTGQGCFSASAKRFFSFSGDTILVFSKKINKMQSVFTTMVADFDIRTGLAGTPVLEASLDPSIDFQLEVPPNLADLYKVDSYDKMLAADFYGKETVAEIVNPKATLKEILAAAKAGAKAASRPTPPAEGDASR